MSTTLTHAAHHRSLARIFRREHALHVVIGGGAGRADEHSLEQQRHDEEAEQAVAILGDLGVGGRQQRGPIQVEMPAEEEVIPTCGNVFGQCPWRDFHHGDDADREGGDGKNAELEHFGDHYAEHPALDDVNGRDGDQDQRVLVGAQMPRQEVGGEFSNALESVSEETDDAEEGVDHHDDVRKLRTAALAEPRLNPIGAGHRVGTAQPARKEHHQKDLIEGRPQPRNPHALHAVDERPVHQQHGAADVEHAGGVRNAQHVPRHSVAAQKVSLHVAGSAMGNPIAHHNRGGQIKDDNRYVDNMQVHPGPNLSRPATGRYTWVQAHSLRPAPEPLVEPSIITEWVREKWACLYVKISRALEADLEG